MKSKIFLLILFLGLLFHAQSKIQIIDSETNKPIPYAKIILNSGENYINTEENGFANINSDQKISEIQAFGYENLKVNQYQNVYSLKPKVVAIEKIEILKPKYKNTFVLGKIDKKSTNGFCASKTTWSVATYFPSEPNFPENVFVKKIRFQSNVRIIDGAKISLQILENSNGIPGEIRKNFIVECKKGKRITEFVFSKPILFPKEGLFIGFEWIINNGNSIDLEEKGTNKFGKMTYPIIGYVNSNQAKTYSFLHEKWYKISLPKESPNLSLELELTD